MVRRTLVRATFLFGCLLPSCKEETPPAPASAAPPAASAQVTGDSAIATAKRLALAKVEGTRPVDLDIRRLQELAAKPNPGPDAWVLLGRAWVKKAREASDPGFYLNAKACADAALDVAPDHRAALNLTGLVLLNQHKFDDARDLADKILLKTPDDRMALGTRSDALLEVGRYDEAQQAAQRMMDIKPNLPAYIRASHFEWLRGDTKAALDSARHAIDAGRDPNDPEPRCWALVHAATLFWHQGDLKGADAGYEAALKECADYPPALAGRGRVALASGDGARAAELLAKSHAASPLPETAWLLGDARAAAGDAKGAEEAYALVVKAGRASDPRTLARFWATKDKEHDQAVKLAQEEKKIRDDLWTEDTLAWALYRAGKIAEAKAASDKATALGTKDPALLYHAGAIKIAAGDKAAGLKLVKEALALNARFDVTGAAEAEKLAAEK
jgi:tetratricopeptide (TPR) repeat protein